MPAPHGNSLPGNLVPVIIIALICVIALSLTYSITRDPIAGNIIEKKLAAIEPVIPLPRNNNISEDFITATAPDYFNQQSVTVFRTRQNGKPTGVVIMPVNARGYSGEITLAIGIHYDGRIAGTSVVAHNETKGIGDSIDQDNSDWLLIFRNRSLKNTPREAWNVSQNGGVYDQISGATITSRGVVDAVRKTLEYYNANRDKLYQ